MAPPRKSKYPASQGYALRDHDTSRFVRRRLARFEPVHRKGKPALFCDLYTELFRFKEGYYSAAVEEARKLEYTKRDAYIRENFDHIAFSTRIRGYKKADHSGVMCLEISAESAVNYMATLATNPPNLSLTSLAWSWSEDPYCIFAGRNAKDDGILVLLKCLPEQHEEMFKFNQWALNTRYGVSVSSRGLDWKTRYPVTYDPHCYIREWDMARTQMKGQTFSWYLKSLKKTKKDEEFLKVVTNSMITLEYKPLKHRGKNGYFVPIVKKKKTYYKG